MARYSGVLADPLFNIGMGIMNQGMQDRPNYAQGIMSGMQNAQQNQMVMQDRQQQQADRQRQQQAIQNFQSGAKGAEDIDAIAKALMSSGDPSMAVKGAQLMKTAQGQQETMFAPQMMKDAEGNVTWGQFGNRGTFSALDTGGMTPYRPPVTFDVGDKRMIYDPVTGQTQEIEKNLAPHQETSYLSDAASAKEEGKAQGTAKAALPGLMQQVDMAEQSIGELLTIPGLENFTGSGAEFNTLLSRAGTNRADFNAKRQQIADQVLMIEFDKLRGAGQITEVEAERAQRAATVIADPKISDAQFMREVNNLRRYLDRTRSTAMEKAGLASGGSASNIDDLISQYAD